MSYKQSSFREGLGGGEGEAVLTIFFKKNSFGHGLKMASGQILMTWTVDQNKRLRFCAEPEPVGV